MSEVEVLDDYKVRFNWIAFGGHTLLQYITNFHEGISIFSKAFFDEVGPEGMRTRIVGTGPFEVTEWTQHKGVFLQALDDHWRKRPYVASANVLQVTEASVRKSMLKTGQAQIGELALTDWKEMFEEGFAQAPEGFWGDSSYVYSGNYWEDKLAIDGQPFTSDQLATCSSSRRSTHRCLGSATQLTKHPWSDRRKFEPRWLWLSTARS